MKPFAIDLSLLLAALLSLRFMAKRLPTLKRNHHVAQ